jgi:hypothetical protein
VHDLPPGDIANVDEESDYARIQVLTSASGLNSEQSSSPSSRALPK